MNFKSLFILTLLLSIFTTSYAQRKKNITIGFLSDTTTRDSQEHISKFEKEVKAVVGNDANIIFDDKYSLQNNFDWNKAEKNYESLVNNPEVDIIIVSGLINNYLLYLKEDYAKPTIIFGMVNEDFIDVSEKKATSGVHNLTYLILPQSYKRDLTTFHEVYPFKKIGILVEKEVSDILPIRKVLDEYFKNTNSTYELMSYSNGDDILNQIKNHSGIDAVYLTGGYYLSDNEISEIADLLIERKLPSFASTGRNGIEHGILMSDSTEENAEQIYRRLSLDIESIVDGTDPSNLPVLLNFNSEPTINVETASKINLSLKYTTLAKANLYGELDSFETGEKYNLLKIMQRAINENLSLKASSKDIDIQDKEVDLAISNYFPKASASANSVYLDPKLAENTQGQNPEFYTSGKFTLEQVIFSEQASAGIKIQKYLLKAQKETFNSSELDAVFQASQAYFNVLIARKTVNINNENLKLTRKNLQIAEQNYNAGQSSKTDVLRWKSQIATSTLNLITAQNTLKQAVFALNQVLNLPIETELDISDADFGKGLFKSYEYKQLEGILDDPISRKKFVDFIVEEALKNAPELKSLDYNIKASERNASLYQRSKFLPTFGLQAEYNYDIDRSGKGSTPPPGFVIPTNNYNVAVNVTLPIFDRTQRDLNRQKTKVQLEQLSINRDNTVLTINQNVNTVVTDIINQIANIELTHVATESARENLELNQIAYTNGAIPIPTLIDAQQNYIQAQQAEANATYNYLLSSIQLERLISYYILLHSKEENNELFKRIEDYLTK
ncbi:TolC family protein [Aureivirga sp. CE67]|uniref:TolC family protein n=1 Tax=Aureivirga sp. CE67 TaxID=1788983 RepID=UPI0018CB5D8F|nr:TolC family protein [Aureivirga sp. CE67]